MATTRVPAEEFTLYSSYTCTTTIKMYYTSSGSYVDRDQTTSASRPALASRTVAFDVQLPVGAKIKSARVHATISSSVYTPSVLTIAGQGVSLNSEALVDVTLPEDGTQLKVPFYYSTSTPVHDHADDPNATFSQTWQYDVPSADNCDIRIATWTLKHNSSVKFSNVYLLIELDGGSVYKAEGDKLVPYQLYHAEDGKLVPYQVYHAEDGKLVAY